VKQGKVRIQQNGDCTVVKKRFSIKD